MRKAEWLLCPLYCPKCKQERLIEVKNLRVTVVEKITDS
jgi:transposase-like protein